MKKRFFAVALAATMALSTAITALGAETITGTAWWASTNGKSSDYTLTGDGSVTVSVATTASDTGIAFNVELWENDTAKYYLTTGSDGNGWWFGGPTSTLTLSGWSSGATTLSGITPGDTYNVTVTRSGDTFTVKYVDATTGTDYCTMTGTSDMPWEDTIYVHVMAQVGTITVDKAADTATTTETTAASTETTVAAETTTVAETTTSEPRTLKINATEATKADTEEEDDNSSIIWIVVGVVAVVVVAGVVVVVAKNKKKK